MISPERESEAMLPIFSTNADQSEYRSRYCSNADTASALTASASEGWNSCRCMAMFSLSCSQYCAHHRERSIFAIKGCYLLGLFHSTTVKVERRGFEKKFYHLRFPSASTLKSVVRPKNLPRQHRRRYPYPLILSIFAGYPPRGGHGTGLCRRQTILDS